MLPAARVCGVCRSLELPLSEPDQTLVVAVSVSAAFAFLDYLLRAPVRPRPSSGD